MSIEIKLPALGEGITDATLIRWLVKSGDFVTKDAPLAEIATDKVDTEVLSPFEGIIEKLLVNENSVVQVGNPIAYISGNSGSEDFHESKSVEVLNTEFIQYENIEMNRANKIETGAFNRKDSAHYRYITPFVRDLAYREGISAEELEILPGTGLGGRITKEDILTYIHGVKKSNGWKSLQGDVTEKNTVVKPQDTDNEVYIEIDRVRKLIAENMVRSKQIAPHVSSFIEVNVTKIVNWRNANKDFFKKKYGTNLTFLPVFIQGVCRALQEFPYINASLQQSFLVLKKQINIGIATALPDGNLIVPVLKNVEDMTLSSIALSVNNLANKARNQSLSLQDLQNGTFTITNAGTFGNIGGTPIIRQPELAILALGAITKKPVAVKTGDSYGVSVQDVVELWLSYDHRIIDGILGGSFLKRLGEILEQFDDTTSV